MNSVTNPIPPQHSLFPLEADFEMIKWEDADQFGKLRRCKMKFLPLIVAVILVFGGAGVYAGFRVIEPLSLGRWGRWMAWSFLLIPAAIPLWLVIDQLEVGKWLDFLLSASYLALGLVSFLSVVAIFRDLGWLLVRLSHGLIGIPYTLPDTLSFMRTSSFLVLGLGLCLSTIAISNALSLPSMRSIQVNFDRLHPDLQGFKIIQLSDLHLGLMRGASFLDEVVGKANSVSPDLVVITGDLTDGSVEKLSDTVRPLCKLKAPVLFVTGNHEYYWTPTEWLEHLEGLGLKVLLDSSHMISHRSATILVAGVSDPTSQVFFPDRPSGLTELQNRLKPTNADLKVLLAHRPGTAYQAEKQGFDLQLSGHTHGGQFFPWNFVIHWIQPFAAGLYRFQNMWIYSSKGTGFWGPPMRLGAQAEIAEIVLSSR